MRCIWFSSCLGGKLKKMELLDWNLSPCHLFPAVSCVCVCLRKLSRAVSRAERRAGLGGRQRTYWLRVFVSLGKVGFRRRGNGNFKWEIYTK